MSDSSVPTAPIVDRLTGLVGREQVVRVVDQADRDRDPLITAVFAIDGLAEINQLCGHDAGDALLRRVGPVLGQQVSVDVTVGRIGGGRLGLVVAPAGDRKPEPTIHPVLDALTGALAAWSADQAALGSPSPVEPVVRAGVAAGEGADTLVAAEAALAAALDDPDGPTMVVAGTDHPGLIRHRRRRRVVEQLAEALDRGLPRVLAEPVECLADPSNGWWCLRPDSAVAVRTDDSAVLDHRDLGPTPGLAARLDRALLDRAVEVGASGETTVVVPLLGPLVGPRSALSAARPERPGRPERLGLVVEVERAQLAGVDLPALCRRLDELGLRVGLIGAVGGWDDARLLRRLPIHHVRPAAELVEAAIADDPIAVRALDDLVATARELGAAIVAPTRPPGDHSDAVAAGATPGNDTDALRGLGVTHRHRST
ncbi:MAG: diguanylate cyclase [Actinomycetota bacterium]